MAKEKSNIKIESIHVTGFEGVLDIEIIPTQSMVTLSGANGAGKSSILHAISILFFGGSFEEPIIHKGKDRAEINTDLGEFSVTWYKTKKSPPKIKIERKDGQPIENTRRALNDLIGGKVLADPMALVNEKDLSKQRQKFLEALNINTSDIDKKIKNEIENRKSTKKEIKALEAKISAIDFNPSITERVVILELTDSLNSANLHNQSLEMKQKAQKRKRKAYDQKKAEVEALQQEMKDLKSEGLKLKSEIEGFEMIDTEKIEQQIKDAETINEQYRANQEHIALLKQVAAEKSKLKDVEVLISNLKTDRDNLLSSASLPDIGITIDDEAVLYNGLPLVKASTGEKIKVCFQYLSTISSNFKVLWIEDGDKLDKKTRKLIIKIAEENNIQVWNERVDESGKIGIYIEEGQVAKNNYIEE